MISGIVLGTSQMSAKRTCLSTESSKIVFRSENSVYKGRFSAKISKLIKITIFNIDQLFCEIRCCDMRLK